MKLTNNQIEKIEQLVGLKNNGDYYDGEYLFENNESELEQVVLRITNKNIEYYKYDSNFKQYNLTIPKEWMIEIHKILNCL